MKVCIKFTSLGCKIGLLLASLLMSGIALADKKVQNEAGKPAETKPAETKPAETKPAETKPAETKPAEKKVSKQVQVSPHQVVDRVTGDLMKIVGENRESLKKDPSKYYAQVRSIMEESVDFGFIARNVMGRDHWKSASKEQRLRFVEVFTTGLVETYAKGMANFSEFEISVVPPKKQVGDAKRATVTQEFKGPNGVKKVVYSMGKMRNGNWKLRNVILEGVNLGKTLQEQFSQSVKESRGDLEKAITDWKMSG